LDTLPDEKRIAGFFLWFGIRRRRRCSVPSAPRIVHAGDLLGPPGNSERAASAAPPVPTEIALPSAGPPVADGGGASLFAGLDLAESLEPPGSGGGLAAASEGDLFGGLSVAGELRAERPVPRPLCKVTRCFGRHLPFCPSVCR
jgi:hypothetical protein